jgi:MFS family permease
LLISPPQIPSIQHDPVDEDTFRAAKRLSHIHTPVEKRTPDGKFVLNPQPDDSPNDPLNWPIWRRNTALFALGVYSMIGGGLTPILAAGFRDVSETYHVPDRKVALIVGLFMLGLGVGGLIASPTGILFGKRSLYLTSGVLLLLSSIWCAAAPSFSLLIVGRIVQGIAMSAIEVFPSATITEIFFLHERAFRLGLYTMLLLSGKNLVPILSALVIQDKGWRWVFW